MSPVAGPHAAVTLAGFAAGSIITASALPKVAERLRRLSDGSSGFSAADLCRDAMQATGNAVWVFVGLTSGVPAMAVFCSVNCLLMATLCVLNLRSGRRPGEEREGG